MYFKKPALAAGFLFSLTAQELQNNSNGEYAPYHIKLFHGFKEKEYKNDITKNSHWHNRAG
jgi:hypothetical protein